jgi:hypothetical protein
VRRRSLRGALCKAVFMKTSRHAQAMWAPVRLYIPAGTKIEPMLAPSQSDLGARVVSG